VVVLAVVIAIAGGFILWQQSSPEFEVAAMESMAFPLPDKPSIAVMPFENLSGDAEQDYVADGVTENLNSSLTKLADLFVIAQNTTSTYKGNPVKVKQVSEELGVRYLLRGSIQRSGDKLRVTTQLIDAISGILIWAGAI
jgi:TolB-like protein